MATYTEIDPELLFAFLREHGYSELEIPHTRERVFGKRRDFRYVREGDNPETDYQAIPLTVRVYTTVNVIGSTQRDCGEDAIRVSLVTRGEDASRADNIRPIASFKRVHRVAGWKRNLAARLAEAEAYAVRPCPRACGGLLLERTRRDGKGKFYGCSRYPSCKATMPLSEG